MGYVWGGHGVAALCANSSWGAGDDIIFAPKAFVDLGEMVGISGTLTGDGISYKNNTKSITCFKALRKCFAAGIEQAGDRQLSRLYF